MNAEIELGKHSQAASKTWVVVDLNILRRQRLKLSYLRNLLQDETGLELS